MKGISRGRHLDFLKELFYVAIRREDIQQWRVGKIQKDFDNSLKRKKVQKPRYKFFGTANKAITC
jgi:hypothetical protein